MNGEDGDCVCPGNLTHVEDREASAVDEGGNRTAIDGVFSVVPAVPVQDFTGLCHYLNVLCRGEPVSRGAPRTRLEPLEKRVFRP
ncbi:hypothetical protein ACFY1J_34195 [Streptomyces sp. NPDC001406]|uniref:hypothetical protein n=1 Tax=Streptomyces sp. NPDC001406 TaxID=3364572 RepID=UPI0036A080CA